MTDAVTASTKCWEGDYRRILRAQTLAELFGPLGPVTRRQIVLNRIDDRDAAEAMARKLVTDGAVDEFAWAEDCWPALAARLGVTETWFGPAWPFSAPELVELDLARTPVVAHVAGDVRIDGTEPWLPRALPELAHAAVVAPRSPSAVELTRPEAIVDADGWVDNHDFSDQCFVARRAELLRHDVVTATHPANGRYPKPGGALTFEARVGAWLRTSGRVRRIDVTRAYQHPVGGAAEGASYGDLRGPRQHLPAVATPAASYPPTGSVPATAVVVARNAVRTIGWTVASLRWAADVVIIDVGSDDGTPQRAAEAGARVRVWPTPTAVGAAVLAAAVAEVDGWTAVVGADEIVPPALAQRLVDVVITDDVDVVEAPTRHYLLGRELTGHRWWPAYAPRLLRPGQVTFPWGVEALRQSPTIAASARVERVPPACDLAVVRLGPASLHDWLAAMNDRTTLESWATELPGHVSGRRALKRLVVALLDRRGRGVDAFGWRLAVLEAFGHWLLTEKAWDASAGDGTTVAAGYDALAASIVTGTSTG